MIDRSLSERPWPSYYPHAGDTLIAVGTIALNYGLLETQLKNVFCAATGMSYAQLNAFFHRIPNDKRRDALEELRDDAKLPDALTTAITRFLDYFEVCADNRHSVMHAFASGEYIDANICDRGLLLSKYSKSGKRLYCQA
jgi:hypothetical protein